MMITGMFWNSLLLRRASKISIPPNWGSVLDGAEPDFGTLEL
jgi:hypothetical protein